MYEAIGCIDDPVGIGMNIPIISRKSDGNRLVFKCGLHLVYSVVFRSIYYIFDGDVGGLVVRVEALVWVFTLST